MKSKKLTYILILLTIFIWGFVAFSLLHEDRDSDQVAAQSNFEEEQVLDTVSYHPLDLNYSDPFTDRKLLRTERVKLNNDDVKKHNILPTASNSLLKKQPIKWPSIVYGGTINGSKGLLSINNRQYIVVENEIYNDVSIKQVFQDSIELEFKETLRVFKFK